jgi:CheY-like chemotaxis protein
MSKIEADKFELSFTNFEFEKMLNRAVSVFEFRLSEKQQNLVLNIDPSVPKQINSDEQRLTQVITNLLTNAVKFTPEGGTITIDAKKTGEGPESCTLEISVTDTGIGIAKEQQENLFQSFVQVDNSISRRFGGTGLGLAISKRIVEMMNGTIGVKSEPGKGSCFSFTMQAGLPGAGADVSAGNEGGPSEEKAGIPDLKGRRILLAEDVDINREIVITILEPTGLVIDTAENGQEAFDKFAANPGAWDLIFMDIHMPGMDGYESTGKIRALDAAQAKTIPILAMTAKALKEDIEKCLAAGMNGHVSKPLNFEEVMSILKKYLTVENNQVH